MSDRRPDGLDGVLLATWLLAHRTEISESGCLVWSGYKNKDGYGTCRNGDRMELSHRLIKTILHGAPSHESLVADHICRVRACVNPDHLRWVTVRDNAIENSSGQSAIHAAKECCPRCDGVYVKNSRGSRYCVPCNRDANLSNYYAKRGERLKQIKAYQLKNADKRREYQRSYYARRKAEKRASDS